MNVSFKAVTVSTGSLDAVRADLKKIEQQESMTGAIRKIENKDEYEGVAITGQKDLDAFYREPNQGFSMNIGHLPNKELRYQEHKNKLKVIPGVFAYYEKCKAEKDAYGEEVICKKAGEITSGQQDNSKTAASKENTVSPKTTPA